jgi:Flp pilus assembly protein TadB
VITYRYAILDNLTSDTDMQQLPEQQYKTKATRSSHVKRKKYKYYTTVATVVILFVSVLTHTQAYLNIIIITIIIIIINQIKLPHMPQWLDRGIFTFFQ